MVYFLKTAWHRVGFGKMASAAAIIMIIFKDTFRDSPDGPVAKTPLPMQGAWLPPLVRELGPACRN